MASKIGVILEIQGQADKVVLVGSGATVKSAFTAAKLDTKNFTGSLTVNGDEADMSSRLHANDRIRVTPKVAGGK